MVRISILVAWRDIRISITYLLYLNVETFFLNTIVCIGKGWNYRIFCEHGRIFRQSLFIFSAYYGEFCLFIRFFIINDRNKRGERGEMSNWECLQKPFLKQ